ncbi:hypothetical protein KUCAC02_024113, partial [Chaenocephalus aceratus]
NTLSVSNSNWPLCTCIHVHMHAQTHSLRATLRRETSQLSHQREMGLSTCTPTPKTTRVPGSPAQQHHCLDGPGAFTVSVGGEE